MEEVDEVKTLSMLQGGPSIIQLLGVKEDDGIDWLIFPYLNGSHLSFDCECKAQRLTKKLCEVIIFFPFYNDSHWNLCTQKELFTVM